MVIMPIFVPTSKLNLSNTINPHYADAVFGHLWPVGYDLGYQNFVDIQIRARVVLIFYILLRVECKKLWKMLNLLIK